MADAWAEVDALLLAGRRLEAARAVMAEFGHPLSQTIVVLGERVDGLRRTRRADFTVDPDGYWDGVVT